MDMLRVNALQYINLGQQVANARMVFSMATTMGQPLSRDEVVHLKATLSKIQILSKDLNLPTSLAMISRHLDNLPQTQRELELLLNVVSAELQDRLFLFVPSHRSAFYQNPSLLSDQAKQAFPSILDDVRDASSCYALGLYTASVYHLMRAIEIGLRKLADKLNVTFPKHPIDLAEMQTIIEQMESKIRDLQNLPRSTQKTEELTFYSSAAMQFLYFKDAHRVHVAHARRSYDENEALSIMNHIREFYNVISGKLSE